MKRAFLLQLLGLIIPVLLLAWLVWRFPVSDYVTHAQRTLGEMEVWGALLYPLAIAGCNLLLLPGGVLMMGSGLFFGLWWGFFLNLAGNLLGAAIAFGLSRALGRQWVARRLVRYQKWEALDAAIARDGWKIIFLSQVHPLFPTSLFNYLYGVMRIRFGVCMLWVVIAQAPGLFLYAYLGTLTQLGVRLWRGVNHPRLSEYIVWLGGLLLTIAVTIALARVAWRLFAELDEAAGAPTKLPPVRAQAPQAAPIEDVF
jgi:uncharacterized membrane protein YdjX (TVP38/TMEM64 family)